MYNVNNNTTYYLYDKCKNAYVRVFKSLVEIRNFVESKIRFRCGAYYLPDNKYFEVKDLSMSFDIRYDIVTKTNFTYDEDSGEYIPRNVEYKVPVQEYVIVDKNLKIFNYTEMVDEIVCLHKNIRINFGLGKTYAGDSTTPITSLKRRRNMLGSYSGAKWHHKGYYSSRLIVNKSERVDNNSNLNDKYYADISDEIEETLNVRVNPDMIKSAYNSMRSDRRALTKDVWEDAYTEQYFKWGHPENWKNHKKSKQWKNNKNTARQTARKDYIKKQMDIEYAYDYDLEAS